MEANRFWRILTDFRTSKAGNLIFYGYLIAVFVAVFLLIRVLNDLHTVANQNHRALCGQKHQYQRSLQLGLNFRRDHPNGTTAFSRGVIAAAIFQDRVQLKALNDVNCGQ